MLLLKESPQLPLRAGVAWINRNDEPRAWGELSSVHGVILSVLPIGTGPATPAEMIDCLPVWLREWVPLNWDELPADMGDLVVLTDDDELTEEAFEAGMNYLEAFYRDGGRFDLSGAWLPAWARQIAE